MFRAVILLTVLCRLASAQCAMPPDIETLTAEQARARISSGATDFFLYKRLIDVTPIRPKPGVLAPDFKKLLDAHSEDPRFLYLYGRALIGKDTPQGLVLLRRAAALEPKLPWTYPALAEIYASPNFHDEQGLLAAMSDFRKLCPSNVEGFRYLDHVKDAQQAGALAVELRTLLERGTDSEQARYWRLLWGAEFRAAPESQYPGLRDRVAADLQKLARLADGTPDMQYTLRQGYGLTGQPEAAAKVDDGCGEYMQAYRGWESKHQLRTRDDITPEEYERIWREEAVLAADWVRKWPSCILAWSSRLSTLRFTPGWTKADVELAGERILQLDRARQIGWSYYPEKLGVAQAWIKYGVRLHESLQMAEDALEQISLGPEQPSDLSAKAADFRRAKQERFGFDHSTWNAMRAVVDAAVQLKDMAKARAMLARMQAWVEQNADRKSDRSSGVERFERLYTTYQGKVAEAEGRKLDALAFYAKALSGGVQMTTISHNTRRRCGSNLAARRSHGWH